MTISYQWLLNYLPEPVPLEKLSKILTSIGLEVEAIETIEHVKGGFEGLVIGQVLTCEKHPNADKLKVTTVNVGAENSLQIVCGAPNVAIGQKVIVAPVGTYVHPINGDSFLIKKAKIRGEESQGMICAEDEIGLGNDHDGIMILPEDAKIGMLVKDYFMVPEADYAIEIGLTPNRSDAMSHIGVARDVCAYLSHHNNIDFGVLLPASEVAQGNNKLAIEINIIDQNACKRYAGISISNVKVAASPEWLKQRLTAIGARPINNIVDVTNFVLHEFGQPLHAFDIDEIKGRKINVGFLAEGTTFTTLDGKERKLEAHDLMISDAEKGLCIAGVFGGAETGVTEKTTNIFLESAYFDPATIRRTSLKHGLRTDAATHFEKGVDINNVIPALKCAATLIIEIAGGEIASEILDVYPKPLEQKTVKVSYDYIHKLSGKNYEKQGIKKILSALGFSIEEETDDNLLLLVPTNKTDVSQPADIVEEILRIDGLNNIEIPERLNISLQPSKPNDRHFRNTISEMLCGEGFQEIVTNSIVNSAYYPERTDMVKMLNSLTSELDVMRPSMLESGLEVIQYNCNRKNTDLLLFEFGNSYSQNDGKYLQQSELAIWITGNVQTGDWNSTTKSSDIFHLKGVLQNIFERLGVKKLSVTTDNETVIWKYKNDVCCIAQQVSDEKLKNFDVKQHVFFASINWERLLKVAESNRIRYQEVPKFPSVQRDLAIIIDKGVTYQQVQDATEQLKMNALREFSLFDIFESEKLGSDKKSYALSYTFQLQDRTLTDRETEELMQHLMTTYKSKLQAQIRD